MPLSVHAPDGAPRGAVVVIQEAFGVNEHIEDVAGRFAAAGWLAIAPHLYHRTGDPKLGYVDREAIQPHMEALRGDQILADVDAALALAAARGIPAARTGIVGFCMGGTVAFAVATQREIGAAVTFYGSGLSFGRFGFPPMIEAAPGLRVPWLGLFGDLDAHIPWSEVDQLREAASTAAVPTEVVRYAEADHGFHCDARASFHEPSARDAWDRTLRWFGAHIPEG